MGPSFLRGLYGADAYEISQETIQHSNSPTDLIGVLTSEGTVRLPEAGPAQSNYKYKVMHTKLLEGNTLSSLQNLFCTFKLHQVCKVNNQYL